MTSAGIDLSFSSAIGRWARFGPYYAMFPIPFAAEVIGLYAKHGQTVIDPFCGRGTVPFIAMVNGINSFGVDINPVAWIYTKTKTDPYPHLASVKKRIEDVRESVSDEDRRADNEFQELAFCPDVLGFIRAAGRDLDWRHSHLDRTVMAFLIQHLHDKRGSGLSNQMRHSRAMSPAYCVRWWKDNGYEYPPEVEAHTFLKRRAEWRYTNGIPQPPRVRRPIIRLGNSSDEFPEVECEADLVFTSPPYCNVTNYRSDNWLRLWVLGEGPELPDWNPEQKWTDPKRYEEMLESCFTTTAKRSHPRAVWYVRSDARNQTHDIIARVLDKLLPKHRRYEQPAPYTRATQTALYGDGNLKPGEIDMLYMPPNKRRRGFTLQFKARK